MSQEPSDSKQKRIFKYQLIPISLVGVISSAVNGIIAYIAVYFFRPFWDKIVKWWKNEI